MGPGQVELEKTETMPVSQEGELEIGLGSMQTKSGGKDSSE